MNELLEKEGLLSIFPITGIGQLKDVLKAISKDAQERAVRLAMSKKPEDHNEQLVLIANMSWQLICWPV